VGVVLGGILLVASLTVGWLALTLGPLNGAAQAAAPAPTATPLIPAPILTSTESSAEGGATEPEARPIAWVIGDSQAAATDSWVIRGLTGLGYDVQSSAVGGIGYLAAVPGHPNIHDLLAGGAGPPVAVDHSAGPAVVVVQAGGNDQTFPLADVRVAAEQAFDHLATLVPDASVVIVGPLVQVEAWAGERRAVSEMLHDLAASRGITFIDATEWVEASGLQPFLVDDRHFSAEGHAELAGIFLGELAAAGLTPSP
jgi:hypothetical protein